MAIALAVSGCAGRMGRRIAALAHTDPNPVFELVQLLEAPDHPAVGKSARELVPELPEDLTVTANLSPGADVLIDFSTPEGALVRAGEAIGRRTAYVIGTTGLTDAQQAAVYLAAETVPVMQASNYSVGINLLARLVGIVARALGEDFDVEITEAHHNQKVDAPSGTALTLARAAADGLGLEFPAALVHGRSGRPGARPRRQIGMHALRMGSVVGDHTVYFGSASERIELTHRAESRDVFAAGALRAAQWLVKRPAGLYDMEKMLFGEGNTGEV